jgi:hypothetical protein
MRLTVSQLKPWIVTALVVLIILLVGGIYLTRTALHAPPVAGPSSAPGSSAVPTSADARVGHRSASHPSASRSSTSHPRSGSSPPSVRTLPAGAATTTPGRTSAPPPVEPPGVTVAGPTIDNVYPDDAGCHVFWISTPGVQATITGVRFDPGPITTFIPQPSGPSLGVDYVACDRTGAGAPLPEVGCGKDQIISAVRSCGVRFVVDDPIRGAIYTGELRFDLSVLCTGTEVTPCLGIGSPYPPSADRPLNANWSPVCQVEVSIGAGSSRVRCNPT